MAARLLRATAIGVFSFYIATGLLLVLYRWLDPPLTTVQVQRCLGTLFAQCGRHDFVPTSQLAPVLRKAVVAAEDARFYQHRGIDLDAIREVAAESMRRGSVSRGASTITQQLVKNLFLTTHSSAIRKVLELPLALIADAVLPKDRQLEIYLNIIEWGPGIFGAENAARHYYGRAARDLTPTQAARLVAVIPNPLHRQPERMQRYGESILRRLR